MTLTIITTPIHKPRSWRRNGTAVLRGRGGDWYLVPSYATGVGITFDWDHADCVTYSTKKLALQARKELREKGKLP